MYIKIIKFLTNWSKELKIKTVIDTVITASTTIEGTVNEHNTNTWKWIHTHAQSFESGGKFCFLKFLLPFAFSVSFNCY